MVPKHLRANYLDLFPNIGLGTMHADDIHAWQSIPTSERFATKLAENTPPKPAGESPLESPMHSLDSEAAFRRLDMEMKKGLE